LVADLAASFQEAVVDVLVGKVARALDLTGHPRVGIGGGVAVNGHFRRRLQEMAVNRGVELFLPPVSLCTDNAAMAGIALAKLAAGQVASLDAEVTPGLVRPAR
jgi:N6-L-threonylcarbamoyladenine synthase